MKNSIKGVMFSGGAAWTPANVPNLVQWIDFSRMSTLYQANNLTTPVTTNGQKILSVTDLSGNGNTLVEGAENVGPDYTANVQNGLSGALFTSDYMLSNFTLNQPYTKIMVIKNNSTGTSRYYTDGRTNTTGMIYRSATPLIAIYAGATVNGTLDPAADAVFIAAAVFNGASSVFYYNAETPATGNAGASNGGGVTYGGRADGGNLANFYSLENIIYSGVISAPVMAEIFANLNSKWAVY